MIITKRPPETSRLNIRLTVVLAANVLLIWFGLRVMLWSSVGPQQAGWVNAPSIFARGLWFDLATVAFLISPFLLMEALLPDRWRAARLVLVVRWVILWAAIFVLLFGAVAEFVFWEEFATRFNFIAVDYLIYTHEVIGNIRQSYPVGWILGGIGLLAFALVTVIFRFVKFSTTPFTWRKRFVAAAAAVALPLASTGLANVDQMEGTSNAYANELSGNGLFSFSAAIRREELDYNRFYRTLPQAQADAVLSRLGVERIPLTDALRKHQPDEHESTESGPLLRKPRNVVLISVESLSADFLGVYGDRRGLTPNLDRLAASGLKFERMFATGTRTVRGLEALSLGTPPVPGQSIVRRPNNEHLATVGELLEHQGFSTLFMYGGYGYFDNMNAYFAGNDYRVIDRTDFPKETIPFENVWGVADEALFDNALIALNDAHRSAKPFFAHVMTTSNHRPFTYPGGRIDIPSPGGREGAVKYTDYAIGRFIKQASSKPWFDETLFIIVADHCASVAGKSKLPVNNYLIPLIFYAPKLLAPGIYPRLASQIDIPPTILDLLGAEGDDHFFGQSLFEDQKLPERAFISNYQELGYYKNGLLTVLMPKQRVAAYRIDPITYAPVPAKIDAELLDEAIAYYQTASRAFRQGALKSPDYQKPSSP